MTARNDGRALSRRAPALCSHSKQLRAAYSRREPRARDESQQEERDDKPRFSRRRGQLSSASATRGGAASRGLRSPAR
eukprot:6173088-Pleurochrysis_carterae.AAC.1